MGPFLERGVSFRANSRMGYKKLAYFQNGVSILGEIFSRTGCQFGVPGSTYPPKKYPSAPPGLNLSTMAAFFLPMEAIVQRFNYILKLRKLTQFILLFQVKEGDEIDLALSKESDEVELSRFRVLAIDKNQTKKNKRRLSGTRFSRILMPRKEFDEHYTQSGEG